MLKSTLAQKSTPPPVVWLGQISAMSDTFWDKDKQTAKKDRATQPISAE